jgi:hypothetical protein
MEQFLLSWPVGRMEEKRKHEKKRKEKKNKIERDGKSISGKKA